VNPKVNAIIFGAPGAGKGTYSTRMQNQLGVDVIAMGDIFRESVKQNTPLGKKVKSFVEKGALVPDDVVVEVLKERLSKVPKGKGFLLDGFPRTIEQADTLEKITKIDVILQLDVSDEIIVQRLTSRRLCKNCGTVYNIRFLKPKKEGICDKCGGSLYQRADDNEEVIRNRLQVYKTQTEPLIAYYQKKKIPFIVSKAKSVDQPPEPMVEAMMEGLKKLKLA
jgi:adenylate kinase